MGLNSLQDITLRVRKNRKWEPIHRIISPKGYGKHCPWLVNHQEFILVGAFTYNKAIFSGTYYMMCVRNYAEHLNSKSSHQNTFSLINKNIALLKAVEIW